MRKLLSLGAVALMATAMMTNVVLANGTGHHTKQSDPVYWNPQLRQQDDATASQQAMKPATVAKPASDSTSAATSERTGNAPAIYQDVEIPF